MRLKRSENNNAGKDSLKAVLPADFFYPSPLYYKLRIVSNVENSQVLEKYFL